MTMNNLTVQTVDTFASLLELAANNDIEAFKRWTERDLSSIHEAGQWYGRQKGSKQMVLEHRTPLMIAATYGSIDVLKLILSLPDVDVNRSCGHDKSTALHCAVSGGSLNAAEAVKLLLGAGADPKSKDVNGHCPIDVIVVSPNFLSVKSSLENLLKTGGIGDCKLRVSIATSKSNSPPHSPSCENRSPSSASDSSSSPKSAKSNDTPVYSMPEKKEYPIDPSLPDIKNNIYSTDEFRMFSFKIRPCSRAYSHDWTECPFVHPGENARRRDPRKYHYSCVPCPEFRKGACQRGDMCEYAHGVFECWLHPAQYRTRLCKDGTDCNRRVCFFAHTQEELRPLYVSTGSAVPSPRGSTAAANAMDFAAAMGLIPGSPSSVSVMSPSPFSPPMSPSANGISSMGWPQQNVPALHLPGSFLHSSRLRSSLNARDIPAADLNAYPDFDVQRQLLNEFSYLSQRNMSSNSLNCSPRPMSHTRANLEDLFSAESSSPRYSDQALAQAGFSPIHKSAVCSQLQQQQSLLSPINTNFSPRNVDNPLLQASFGVPSSGRMSPRAMEPISPRSPRASILAQRDKQHQFRSFSSRDLGSNVSAIVGSPADTWGTAMGKPDWAVSTGEFCRLRRSSSFELANNGEEPDLSWVQSLVKESPPEMMKDKCVPHVSGPTGAVADLGEGSMSSSQIDQSDQLSAWMEQMKLHQ
ncbi:zinc finger CCCH domain-containing protein 30-like [Nicotiana tomentosiformis]|uniref:zinc finger CCCH domain-containing protein 30-like n=1 Tax=Nicotiana tomentosiformis TaxID=4098 RepID=UPI000878D425|nr:zinc finger CCCH domain-containing protein 30-like [Nicotiana tomentosiformis]XP_018632608.1 zinc finger CCCH domain-containing protein 30-like [Nicotiana tomentosiformis]